MADFVGLRGINAVGDGGEDIFYHDSSDTTSAANGGTIAVSGGDRYKRVGAARNAVNVKWWAATGDGSTNDTAAINSAISAAQAGDTIYLPRGTYVVHAGSSLEEHKNNFTTSDHNTHLALRITKSLHFVGDGATLKLVAAKTGSDLSHIAGNISTDAAISNVTFYGITFDLDVAGNSDSVQPRGLIFHNVTSLDIDNCHFTGGDTKGGYGISLFNCEFIKTDIRLKTISGGLFMAYCRHFHIKIDADDYNECLDLDKICEDGFFEVLAKNGGETVDTNSARNVYGKIICRDSDRVVLWINGKHTAENWADHLTQTNLTWLEPRNVHVDVVMDNCCPNATAIVVGNDWDAAVPRDEGTYPRNITVSYSADDSGSLSINEGECYVQHFYGKNVLPPKGGSSQAAIRALSETDWVSRILTSFSISTAGSGYQVGEEIELVGGTRTAIATILVQTIDGSGGVTGGIVRRGGRYTVPPTGTVATVPRESSGTGFTVTTTFDDGSYFAAAEEGSDCKLTLGDIYIDGTTRKAIDIIGISEVKFAGHVRVRNPNSQTDIYILALSVDSAGTGYAVGDTLKPATGTATTDAVIEVTAVGQDGEITDVFLDNVGSYTSKPTDGTTTAITGTGTGATFDFTWSGNDNTIQILEKNRAMIGVIDNLDIDGTPNGNRGVNISLESGARVRWGANNLVRDHAADVALSGANAASLMEAQERTIRWGDFAGGGAAKEKTLFRAPCDMYVYEGLVSTSNNITADATNYVSFILRKRDSAGVNPATIVGVNTSENSVTEHLPFSIDGLISDTDQVIAKGELITLLVSPTGTAPAAEDVTVTIKYMAY